MPFFLARGWTLTANVAPDGESLMGITRTSTAEAWRHGEFLEECSLPSPRTLRLYNSPFPKNSGSHPDACRALFNSHLEIMGHPHRKHIRRRSEERRVGKE